MATLDSWNSIRNAKAASLDTSGSTTEGLRVPLHLQNSVNQIGSLPQRIAGMKNEFANNVPPNSLDRFGNQLPGGHELSALQEKLAMNYASSPQDMPMRLVVTRLFDGVGENTQSNNAVKTIAKNFESLRNDPAFAPLVDRLFTEQSGYNKQPAVDKSVPLLLAGAAKLPQTTPLGQLQRIINYGQIAKLDEHSPSIPHYPTATIQEDKIAATEKTSQASSSDPHKDLKNFIAEAKTYQPAEDSNLTSPTKSPAHRLT